MAKDLYAVLGVQKGASQDDIRKAYRKLARKYHPDVRPDDAAAEQRFKEVSQANNVLGDPEKRKLYDEFGDAGLREGFNAEQARAYAQFRGGRGRPSGFGGQGFGGQGFSAGGEDMSDILSQLFGGGGGRQRSPFGGGRQGGMAAKGGDVEANLSLDFLDAIKGSERTLTLRVPNASGGEETKQIKVRIPPGAKDGGRIRLRGKGRPGQRGGKAGDLLLTIHVRSHPQLRRIDDDLELDVPITVGEAILGGKVTVPTLDGQVTVTIPPGSQSGQRMRLRNKGVPKKKGDAGALYLVLKVILPDQGSEDLQKLAEAMESHYGKDIREDLRI